ncbi:MAG: Crp/Fnr family transcriptional regulator [Bradyrhizobium sp.]
MLNLINAARMIRKDCQANPAYMERLDPSYLGQALHVAGQYKSADREVKAGSDLFRLGEGGEAIYSLVDGWVALYHLLQDGRRQILQFALPGAVLAFVPTPGALLNYSAQALTDAVVSVISHKNLGRLARDCPEIGMQIAGLISRDRSLAYHQLLSVGRRSARERIAHLLLELSIRSRMRWLGNRPEEMHLPLTQEHIGDATGLTGVHVNRVLRDLHKEGILGFHYRRLRILNPDKLVDVAGIDPQVAMTWITVDSSDELVADHRSSNAVPRMAHVDTIRRRGPQPAARSVALRVEIPEGIDAA